MRVGVLEWASCGGMVNQAEAMDSIAVEGWAMCRAALASLICAGHQAVALVEARCASDPLVSGYRADQLELVQRSACRPAWQQWRELYSSCDYTLVIAPECQRILERLLLWFRSEKMTACNCSRLFVRRASDKLRTAQLLSSYAVPHPPTLLLADAQKQWISDRSSLFSNIDRSAPSAWVIKPRDGVGCEGTLRVGSEQLHRGGGFIGCAATAAGRELDESDERDWIVQPWLAGQACSRSAIVDRDGRLHWLPVTRQHLSVSDRVVYGGGSVEPELAARIVGLDETLTRAVEALGGRPRGWVGVDFLYDEDNRRQPITIIEVNPRLTTSFVGLASAGATELAGAIVAAVCGQQFELPRDWQQVCFTTAGECTLATGRCGIF